jgi:hypothetical protein
VECYERANATVSDVGEPERWRGSEMKRVSSCIVFVLLLSLQALAAEVTSSPGQHGTLQIISAKYGAGQTWMDVTEAVSDRVAETGAFYIPAGASNCASTFGKDPLPNVRKTIMIKYSYSDEQPGTVHNLVQFENNEIRIPGSRGVVAPPPPGKDTPEVEQPIPSMVDSQPDRGNVPGTSSLYGKYRCEYAFIDGEYIRLPDFDLKYENSRRGGRLPEAAKYRTRITYSTRQVTRRSGANAVTIIPGDRTHKATVQNDIPYETVYEDEAVPTREWLPQDAIENIERAWRTELPDLVVGAFGIWPDSERIAIVHILGPDDLILACNTKSFRLKGVNTAGFQAGDNMLMSTFKLYSYTLTGPRLNEEWSTDRVTGGGRSSHESGVRRTYVTQDVNQVAAGPKLSIAIVAMRPVPGFSAESMLLAMPTEMVREGLTPEQFADMLRSGVDPEKHDNSAKPLWVVKEADDDPKPALETQKK